MRSTHRSHVTWTVIRELLAALLAALATCTLTPVYAHAQAPGARPLIFDQYLSRARLDESVAGPHTRLDGIGFRLTSPIAATSSHATSRLADGLAMGGFVTYARSRDDGLTAWHFGAQADVPVRPGSLPEPVQPLLSLGVGALRTQLGPSGERGPSPHCLAPTDVAVKEPVDACVVGVPRDQVSWHTHMTLSPAAGLRLALGRGIGLRADVRDVIVLRGAARHSYELATGLSFVR